MIPAFTYAYIPSLIFAPFESAVSRKSPSFLGNTKCERPLTLFPSRLRSKTCLILSQAAQGSQMNHLINPKLQYNKTRMEALDLKLSQNKPKRYRLLQRFYFTLRDLFHDQPIHCVSRISQNGCDLLKSILAASACRKNTNVWHIMWILTSHPVLLNKFSFDDSVDIGISPLVSGEFRCCRSLGPFR